MRLPSLLLAAFLLSGCNQWNRLIGNEEDDSSTSNLNGLWTGDAVINGASQRFALEIIQTKNAIVGGIGAIESSYVSIHTIGLSAKISGSVNGKVFQALGQEGTVCENKWTIVGEAQNGQLMLRFYGIGNDLPGTSCHPTPIDTTVIVKR